MAKTQRQIIAETTLKGRKQWENFSLTHERRLFFVLQDSAAAIDRKIARFAERGVIPPSRLAILRREIRLEMAALRPRVGGLIKRGVSNSVDIALKASVKSMDAIQRAGLLNPRFGVQIGSSFIGKDGIVRRYNAAKETFAQSTWAKINTNAVEASLSWNPGGLVFSERVWDLTYQSQKIILSKVSRAVVIGQSAEELSREIRQHLAQPVTLRGGARANARPGVGVARSAYKNALRLSRTELARAYNEGTVRYAKTKTWLKGYISRVTSANPAPYDDSVDGQFFPKDDPPAIPYHPNCVCYAELVTEDIPDDQLVFAQSQDEFDKQNN